MDEKTIVALMSVFAYIIGQRKSKEKKSRKNIKINYWRLAAKLDVARAWEYEL